MSAIARKIKAALKDRALRWAGLEVKAEYITTLPSAQNSLDLFPGDWASKLPPPFETLHAGNADLFNDKRILWLRDQLGGFDKMRVFECGPLEGGHTYMLEKFGADSILSVEAGTRAFLRCLVLKEMLGTHKSRFLLGDFVRQLGTGERYDLVLACGVLYHLVDPVAAIATMSKVTDQIYVWTHYYDEQKIKARAVVAHHFQGSSPAEHDGFKHTLHRQQYQSRLGNPGFMGGSEHYSHWLSHNDLLEAIRFFGFTDITIHFDEPDGAAGPNISLLARRRK